MFILLDLGANSVSPPAAARTVREAGPYEAYPSLFFAPVTPFSPLKTRFSPLGVLSLETKIIL